MITEDEAFWAGIAVATMMLGGGFSMLFLAALTGYGSVVLALGLMTMVLTIQMRAKPIQMIDNTAPIESQVLMPSTPVDSFRNVPESQRGHTEAVSQDDEASHADSPESTESPRKNTECSQPVQPAEPESTEPKAPEQPQHSEKPKEEPPIVLVEN